MTQQIEKIILNQGPRGAPGQYVAGSSPNFTNLTLTGYLATNKRDESSAATLNAMSNIASLVKLTSTVTTINGISAGVNGQIIVVYNATGSTVTINHQNGSASAANRIISTDGASINLTNNTPQAFVYDSTQSRWVVWGGGGSLDPTLAALAAFNTNGLLTQTASDTFTGRTLTGTSNQVIVTNGDGVSGNPTISLDPTLVALGLFNTNGLLTQTASDTFTGRTITGTTNQVNVSNGDGVSGNPTLSLPQSIHTGASPTFAGLTVGSSSGPVRVTSGVIGTGNTSLTSEVTGVLPMANGGFNANLTAANGSIPYSSASAIALLAAGTAGQVLTTQGAGAPTFEWGARPQVFGTSGSPRSIVAGTGITSGVSHMSTTALEQLIFVTGSAAGDNVSATITAGTIVGQKIMVIGKSATNTVTLDDATTTNFVGSVTLGLNSIARLVYDGTNWLLT